MSRKYESLKNKIINLEKSLIMRSEGEILDTTESHWFSGYKEVKPKIGSIYRKGQKVKGYLKSLTEIRKLGFRIETYNREKSRIVHPCGKHLTIYKNIIIYAGTTIELTFQLEEIRDNRQIWKVMDFYNGGYGYSVYGEMFTEINENLLLEDDLFTI